MKGMQNNAQRNQPEHDTQKRSGAMRNLQETHSPHRDLQSASAGHSDGDQIRKSGLRGTREEVKFSLKAPVEDGARFSLRSTENIIRENAALQKENDLLQQRLSFDIFHRTSMDCGKKFAPAMDHRFYGMDVLIISQLVYCHHFW